MVEIVENDNELCLKFSITWTLPTSDTHNDPSLGNGPCLEINIDSSIILVIAHLTSWVPSIYYN